MIKEKKTLNNFGEKYHNLNESDLSHISENDSEGKKKSRIDRNQLLNLIRKNVPISIWHLKQISGIGYATLWRIIRELEYVGLIETRYLTNKNNRGERVISIPEEVKNGNDS